MTLLITYDPPLLSWDVLDACTSADEIAALLKRHGIKGWPGDISGCALAQATGWIVCGPAAPLTRQFNQLTDAERRFIQSFDDGNYSELEVQEKSFDELIQT